MVTVKPSKSSKLWSAVVIMIDVPSAVTSELRAQHLPVVKYYLNKMASCIRHSMA